MNHQTFFNHKINTIRFFIASLIGVIIIGGTPKISSEESVTAQSSAQYFLSNNQIAYKSDRGKFKVGYADFKNQELNNFKPFFIAELKTLANVAHGLNELFILPRDIPIILQECGQPNAFYDKQEHRITVCYELVAEFAKFTHRYATSKEDWINSTVGGTIFVFFHELGHTLIHELDLPAVGREEDDADQMAVVIETLGGDILVENSALVVATQFRENGGDDNAKNLPYWDEHSLNPQRYYNILCLIYGSNPSKYASTAKLGGLPGSRARQCQDEYQQAKNSWLRLLEPHMQTRQEPYKRDLW